MRGLLTALLLLGPFQSPTGTVIGQLLPREGVSVAGIRVSARVAPEPGTPVSSGTTLVSLALTDSAGRYRLENVFPGRYYVTAGLVDLPTYYPGVSSANDATVIDVAAGATVRGIDFVLTAPTGGAVRGRVIPPAGVSVEGIPVALTRGPGSPPQIVSSRADGSFEFSKVHPGNYSLVALLAAMAQPVTFSVTDKDVTGLEAVLTSVNAAPAGVVFTLPGMAGVPALPAPPPTRISEQALATSLIFDVKPRYPEEAKRAGIEGTVVLEATINRSGNVESLTVLSGIRQLNQAALDAVREQRYRPAIVNGQAVPVQSTITVNFKIP